MLHLCIHQNFHNFVTKCDWTRELKTKQQVPVGIDRTLKEDHPQRWSTFPENFTWTEAIHAFKFPPRLWHDGK